MKRKLYCRFLTVVQWQLFVPVYSTEHYTRQQRGWCWEFRMVWLGSQLGGYSRFYQSILYTWCRWHRTEFCMVQRKKVTVLLLLLGPFLEPIKTILETFEGTAGDVDQELTGDKAYEYNHVTVTGLEPETTYYYTVEKKRSADRRVEYKTQKTDSVKILYVGDPQIGASKGQTQDGRTDQRIRWS